MRTVDFHALRSENADFCIVGSGPVGMCLAVDLVERGFSVLILESGLSRPNRKIQSLSEAEVNDPHFHEPMSLATCRSLGGTSQFWGGRCTEMDDIDFAARDYAPNSGWPIVHDDVSRFYGRARTLLGIGNESDSSQGKSTAPHCKDVRFDQLEMWVNETRIDKQLRRFKAFEQIKIALNATVVDFEFDPACGTVSGLIVANQHQRSAFRGATSYILALGGIETARLLLNVQARHPQLFNGGEGVLGRYYMGHVSGTIADITLARPADALHFRFQEASGAYLRNRLAFSQDIQRKQKIPNTSFWPDNPRLGDASHEDGLLSAIFLILSASGSESAIVPELIRRYQVTSNPQYLHHIRNCLRDLPHVLAGATEIARQKFADGRRLPRWFDVNERGTYPLHFHAEHWPRRSNAVTLSQERDYLGMRRASINFEFSDENVAAVYEAHRYLDQCLRAAGIGTLTRRCSPDEFITTKQGLQADGLHQLGLTRMAGDPSRGVVDSNCRVFGFNNLYVAGTSVFTTSGQANPTFPAIALALRLAEHLDHEHKRLQVIASATETARSRASLRVLHVISSIDTASGGPARAVFDLALAARLLGHEVCICTSDYGGPKVDYADYERAGIEVKMFPVSHPWLLECSLELGKYIEDNIGYYDIVHVHSLYLYHDWAVYRQACRQGVSYILRPHGTYDPVIRERKVAAKWILERLFQEQVTYGAMGIHYTSDDEQRLSNCQNRTSWVVPLPMRMEEFDGMPADEHFKATHRIKSDYMLFLGRLAWKKGLDILIRSFADFAKIHPQAELVVAGPDYGEEEKIRTLVRSKALESKVHFVGVLDGAERVAAYRNAKLFVLPSRGENFGRTAAEAMIVGTPIVMTNCVGIWQLCQQEDAALIVQADEKSLLAGLLESWQSESSSKARAGRARTLVESQFGLQRVGEALEKMYREAIGRNRDRRELSTARPRALTTTLDDRYH
jgi:glycosyltransferase involved in cell wall biosynthesis